MRQRIIIISMLIFTTCQNNPTSPSTSSDSRPIIGENDFSKINISLVDYNVIHIFHRLGVDLRSSNIFSTIIGSKNKKGIKQLYSLPSSYDQEIKSYIIHFDFTIRMDSSQLNAPLTIRYLFLDSNYVDFDTTVALYKYPYSSTEIIADSTILPGNEPFQDISRIGAKLYYHPIGPWGLFEYDLVPKSKRMLYEYSGGDHLAADSNFIFCDISHNSVFRYNIITNAIDFEFPLPTNIDLIGMATFDHALYIDINGNGGYYLKKYTFDGELLDSIAYPREVYYLAIFDSIAYSGEYYTNSPSQISRFDLRTKTYRSNILCPTYSIDGIKAYGDKLYFCDFYKKCVCSVPFKDLVEIAISHKNSKITSRAPNQRLKLTE